MSIVEIKANENISSENRTLLKENGYSLVKKNSMLGGDAAWAILGTVSTASIAAITKVVIELIKAKASVEIEINGVKAKGISQESAEKLLRDACKDD